MKAYTQGGPLIPVADTDGSGAGPDFLSLDQGASTTEGNWIKLDTTGSSQPNGTLLAYATDAAGNLVVRDGETGPGVTLREATLGHVGSVASDSGSVLFNGSQSVYLGAGLQLHFAVQTGDDAIQQVPGVTITGTDTLSMNVSGTFGTLQLLATVNNTLSADAELAAASRDYDVAWTYLMEGSTVQVEVAGSAANTNTVHFVLLDIDAATGGWSVGGVAYGNTDAFRAAVPTGAPSFIQLQGESVRHLDRSGPVVQQAGARSPRLSAAPRPVAEQRRCEPRRRTASDCRAHCEAVRCCNRAAMPRARSAPGQAW